MKLAKRTANATAVAVNIPKAMVDLSFSFSVIYSSKQMIYPE